MSMQSEEHRDHNDSAAPQGDDAPRPRPIAKGEPRSERLSGDHIHLSPRAQRRMAMGRRSAF